MKRLTQRRLRWRCDLALRGLTLPSPWSLNTFLADLGHRRGRPILLAAAPELAGTVSAQWWKERDADVILHAPTQNTFYLELNVFHEVGHMLCKHDSGPDSATGQSAQMEVLSIAPGAARTILSRSSAFDSIAEQEAELVAYHLKLRAERAVTAAAAADPNDTQIRDTMRRTLGS